MKAKEKSTELWTAPDIKIISVDETMNGSSAGDDGMNTDS